MLFVLFNSSLDQSRDMCWNQFYLVKLKGFHNAPTHLCVVPGTVSAVNRTSPVTKRSQEPRSTMELGREGGVQAMWPILGALWLCLIKMTVRHYRRHLIVWKWVQLVLPATQEMQESKLFTVFCPPQTTSLPPDRRDMLGINLSSGRSGMEQSSEEGNSSTLEMKFWW